MQPIATAELKTSVSLNVPVVKTHFTKKQRFQKCHRVLGDDFFFWKVVVFWPLRATLHSSSFSGANPCITPLLWTWFPATTKSAILLPLACLMRLCCSHLHQPQIIGIRGMFKPAPVTRTWCKQRKPVHTNHTGAPTRVKCAVCAVVYLYFMFRATDGLSQPVVLLPLWSATDWSIKARDGCSDLAAGP